MGDLMEEFNGDPVVDGKKFNMSIRLSSELMGVIDNLKDEWGLRSGSRVVEILLVELLLGGQAIEEHNG